VRTTATVLCNRILAARYRFDGAWFGWTLNARQGSACQTFVLNDTETNRAALALDNSCSHAELASISCGRIQELSIYLPMHARARPCVIINHAVDLVCSCDAAPLRC